MFIDFRERGREIYIYIYIERERERNIDQLPPVYGPTRDQTHSLLVHRTMPQLSHPPGFFIYPFEREIVDSPVHTVMCGCEVGRRVTQSSDTASVAWEADSRRKLNQLLWYVESLDYKSIVCLMIVLLLWSNNTWYKHMCSEIQSPTWDVCLQWLPALVIFLFTTFLQYCEILMWNGPFPLDFSNSCSICRTLHLSSQSMWSFYIRKYEAFQV